MFNIIYVLRLIYVFDNFPVTCKFFLFFPTIVVIPVIQFIQSRNGFFRALILFFPGLRNVF
jgi:hypothetical protein